QAHRFPCHPLSHRALLHLSAPEVADRLLVRPRISQVPREGDSHMSLPRLGCDLNRSLGFAYETREHEGIAGIAHPPKRSKRHLDLESARLAVDSEDRAKSVHSLLSRGLDPIQTAGGIQTSCLPGTKAHSEYFQAAG